VGHVSSRTCPGTFCGRTRPRGKIHVMRQFAPNPVRVILPGMCYPERGDQHPQRDSVSSKWKGWPSAEGITMADLKGDHHPRFAPPDVSGRNRQVRDSQQLLPVHRARASKWISTGRPMTRTGNRLNERQPAGWKSSGPGWSTPTVLRNGGYDPDRVTGFAFGMGPQRMLMLKRAIDDIRLFLAERLAVPAAVSKRCSPPPVGSLLLSAAPVVASGRLSPSPSQWKALAACPRVVRHTHRRLRGCHRGDGSGCGTAWRSC